MAEVSVLYTAKENINVVLISSHLYNNCGQLMFNGKPVPYYCAQTQKEYIENIDYFFERVSREIFTSHNL